METFKQRMKRIRVRAGYRSQGAAAEAIGCERGTVSMWEAPSSNVQKVSSDLLFDTARVYRVRPDWINDLRSQDDGYPWSPSQVREPTPSYEAESQPAQLDIGKLTTAQKFLEDLFRAEGVRFVASEQTMLLAAVYNELITQPEPNVVDMATRFGRTVRGLHERQGASGSTFKDDRGRAGEGEEGSSRTKDRKAG